MPPLISSHTIIWESSGALPIYFGIANTQTALVLSTISFEFRCTNSGGYVYDYLGDPIIEYSDDNTTWTPVPTSYSLGPNTDIQYMPASGPAPASYTGGKTITITQTEHATVHNYWRVVFQTGSFASSNHRLLLCIYDIVWINPSSTTLFEANTNFGVDDIDALQYAQTYGKTNGENVLYLTTGTNKQPMSITYATGTFTVSDFSPTVNGVSIWQTNGFPACVSIFQNRLCFAGFEAFKGRVIMSEFGDFTNYTMPSPMTATAPITVDSLQLKSRIDFLWAGDKALYSLSNEGVAMIDAGGGVIATDQIEFQLRNREPAAAVLPTVKDDVMIYVGRNQQKILITDFDFVVQRYRAVVMSMAYDNFLMAGIKALHYIPTKAALIYGILNNGKGFAWLFNQPQQNNGLFPMSISGSISDILPIKYKDTTKLLMVTDHNTMWNIISKDPQPESEMMDFMSEQDQKAYTQNFIMQNNYLDYCCSYDETEEFSYFPVPESFLPDDTIEVLADGMFLGVMPMSTKTLIQLANANFGTEYYVASLTDGEPAWVQNTETGVWDCYGKLSIVGGVMSINNITVTDQNTTLDVVCCDLVIPAKRVNFGIPYNSHAVIKFVSPYMIRKFPREIGINFINTGYLELGNSFNDMRPVLGNIAETVTLDNMPILMNGNYEKTLDKQAFETPYVIVGSSKGLPFSITGIDYEVDYSNYQGGV